MSGLRAEDVKEAATIYEEWLAETGNAPGPAMAPLLAAARLWLVSQEQTPDTIVIRREDRDRARRVLAEIWKVHPDWPPITETLDALVGFYPQPEGDER